MNSADVSRGIESVPITSINTDTNDFVYVRCNIPGPSIARKKFHEQYEGCTACLPASTCNDDCNCVIRMGQRQYNEHRQLIDFDPYSQEMKPVYECNKECRCSQTCFNRVAQHGVQIPLQVFLTQSKGLGLRTLEKIPQHQFVCEYAGEILCHETAKKRIMSLGPKDSNYILVVKEHVHTGEQIRTIVDPTYIGNIGRFVNHSCEPNLYMLPVHVNNIIPHIALFALRDIQGGEELTFNYSGELIKHSSSTEEEEQGSSDSSCAPVMSIQIKPDEPDSNSKPPAKKVCQCGAKHCLGYLPFDHTLFKEGDASN